MIYKDAKSASDHEACPQERRLELCLNCGKDWIDHSGWSCIKQSRFRFHELPSNERYETLSMRASLIAQVPIIVAQQKPKGWDSLSTPKAPTTKPETDLSDWRAWRNQAPGECPCGIVKTMCDYHR